MSHQQLFGNSNVGTYEIFGVVRWLGYVANKSALCTNNFTNYIKIKLYYANDLASFYRENMSLQHLTLEGCEFTPKYISSRVVCSGYVDGTMMFMTEIIMERIQGRVLKDVLLEDYKFPRRLPKDLNNQISALYERLEKIHNIEYEDQHEGNIILDTMGKIWIIDFEC